MSAIKKTISINENVAKEASAISPNFSAVVEAALIEYIHHHRVNKALQSFGGWGKRQESSGDIVNELRREDDREYVRRNDASQKHESKTGHG